MGHSEEIKENIRQLDTRLIDEQRRLTAITQTRCFFRSGIERCVTIAPLVDINIQRGRIEIIIRQIEALKSELISHELEQTTIEIPTEIVPITQETIPLVETRPNNTLRNALILGGLILLV